MIRVIRCDVVCSGSGYVSDFLVNLWVPLGKKSPSKEEAALWDFHYIELDLLY
jgi:hypothetical protein